ncbi:MAG: heavy-metal-associated domain-containing protein [Acidobacteria bacterium]|nr:heavy-metal-associated domain-containing protein [Acidobacteriota bacterium]
MLRRKFFKVVTIATTGALTPLEAISAAPAKKVVTYHVRGFSCVTCATGLDTMLRQQKGITSSSSTYPQSIATIGFDPDRITETQIKDFIASLGFTVEEHTAQSPPASRQ